MGPIWFSSFLEKESVFRTSWPPLCLMVQLNRSITTLGKLVLGSSTPPHAKALYETLRVSGKLLHRVFWVCLTSLLTNKKLDNSSQTSIW